MLSLCRSGVLVLVVSSLAGAAFGTPDGIARLSAAAQVAMAGRSWTPGCPVPLGDLASVTVDYVGFDGADHRGVIVIHKRFATDVSDIFKELHTIRFPIRNISTYESYEVGKYADHDATVGFYCRKAQDARTEWSGHAYGAAIDINPVENPFRCS